MIERFAVVIVAFAAVLLGQRLQPLLRGPGRDRLAYGFLLLVSMYISLNYLLQIRLPGLYELADLLLGGTARAIYGWLYVPS